MEKFSARQIEIMEAATNRIDEYGIQNLTIKNLAADVDLSEPALYRHFAGKNEILLSLMTYYTGEMRSRLSQIASDPNQPADKELMSVFESQYRAFAKNPAIVSITFSESIFHFDERLSQKVADTMEFMHRFVCRNIIKGQETGLYNKEMDASVLANIVLGGTRLTIIKWKQSGHSTSLVKDGKKLTETFLTMIKNPTNEN